MRNRLTVALLLALLLAPGCARHYTFEKPALAFDDYYVARFSPDVRFPKTEGDAWKIGHQAIDQLDPGSYRDHHLLRRDGDEWLMMLAPDEDRGIGGYTLWIRRVGTTFRDDLCYAVIVRTP